MKFYNREKEIKIINKIKKGKGVRVVVIKGFRRIGKTRLVLEAFKNEKSFIRIFIPKDKTTASFLEDVSEKYNLPLFRKIKDLFLYLFEKYKFVFFDEFQNFLSIEPSIYSELQNILDELRFKEKDLCLFLSGSSYSMLKKIFHDYAKALYGRRDIEINLGELDIKSLFKMLHDIEIKNIEDMIKFYSIFGGVPKFYELLYNLNIKSFEEFYNIFLKTNYQLLFDEGKTMLISELGGEYKSYFTVLEAISKGRNKLSEIAGFFENNINATNRYVNLLKDEYGLIKQLKPVIGKGSIYVNKSNFFDFWFLFINKYASLIDEIGVEKVVKEIETKIPAYFGRKFENFILELIKEGVLIDNFTFTKIGKQWGKIPKEFKPEKGKNTYEIDILALNEKTKEILFAECKWKSKVNAKKIVEELAEKSQYVQWHNDERKESFAIFAKSFSKKIKEFEGRKVFCFDLRDLEKILRKNFYLRKRK